MRPSVGKLIEILKKYPSDCEVCITIIEDGKTYHGIRAIEHILDERELEIIAGD